MRGDSRQSFLDDGGVRAIVRLGAVERLNNEDLTVKRANRSGFEFDGVDARATQEDILAAVSGEGDSLPLTVLRVLTTLAHFEWMSGRTEPREGDWFVLELERRGKVRGPYAWAAPLDPAGYRQDRRLVLKAATWLFHEDERAPRALGAAVPQERMLARTIAAACEFPAGAIGKLSAVRALLKALPPLKDAVVQDVGQASLVSLRDAKAVPRLHLDAGWPISWNYKTAPGSVPAIPDNNPVVLLSHWDWDHLHGYHRIPALAAATWITPVQKLSPTKKPIAAKLAKEGRLFGVGIRRLAAGPVLLGRCSGPKTDANHSGLAFRVGLASGKSLLFMGDADYNLASSAVAGPSDLLVVTHHGAAFNGSVATPSKPGAPAVVSVGAGNGYRHPSSVAVAAHEGAGWSLRYTSDQPFAARGRRILGP